MRNKSTWRNINRIGTDFRLYSASLKIELLTVLLTICFILCNPADIPAGETPVEYNLNRVEGWLDIEDYFLVDLDGDGHLDFLRFYTDHHTYQVMPFSRERLLGPAYYQGNSTHWICCLDPVEVDTLAGSEVAVVKKDLSGDSLWVEIHSGFDNANVLCRTQAIIGENISERDNHKNPGWDGSANHCHAADLDDDGSPEIIIAITVGFDLYPRGIYVYSYPSGKLKWSFPLAGNPLNLVIADANKDGFREIYIKTWPCANGAVVEDRSDTNAYVYSLDHLGNVLWSKKLGDRFDFQTGNVHLCDCDNDDTLEVYYTVLLRQDEYDQQVRVLEKHRAVDNLFLSQHSFDADKEFRDVYSADLNSDGQNELLIDCCLQTLDPTSMSVINFGDFHGVKVEEITDLDHDTDSLPEIIITKDDSLYIVDAQLNLLHACSPGSGQFIKSVSSFITPYGKQYLGIITKTDNLGTCNKLSVFAISAAQVGKPPIPFSLLGKYLPGLIIGICLGIIVGYILSRGKQPKTKTRATNAAQYNNLLTTLVNFNHGHMAGKNLNRLLFLFSNLPETSDKLEEIKPNLKSAIEAYESFTSSQLLNIIAHAGRLVPIKSKISLLDGQIKILARDLGNLAVAELTVAETHGLKTSIPETISNIKHVINDIRGHVQTRFSANLLRVIPEVLAAVAGRFQQGGVGFSEITTKGGVGALVFFDEIELASLFEEFLSNACDAMAESKMKELSLDIKFHDGEAVIKLTDTGHGLQVEDNDQIFSRGYSTRGGDRGYGLFHARQQVERFGGHIRLYNNLNGPGSTVELILKKVGYE